MSLSCRGAAPVSSLCGSTVPMLSPPRGDSSPKFSSSHRGSVAASSPRGGSVEPVCNNDDVGSVPASSSWRRGTVPVLSSSRSGPESPSSCTGFVTTPPPRAVPRGDDTYTLLVRDDDMGLKPPRDDDPASTAPPHNDDHTGTVSCTTATTHAQNPYETTIMRAPSPCSTTTTQR